MGNGFDLTNVNINIQKCLSSGAVGLEPIKALIIGDSFVPKEGWLWDYKECLKTDALSLSKTVLQIASFYNTCGGYIVYGVKEAKKNKEFVPVDLDLDGFDPAQLRDKIKNFTNKAIDFTFSEVDVELQGKLYKFGLIFVPKRPYADNSDPVSFVKNGPDKSSGKPIFCIDDVYFRCLDECLKADCTKDWQTLFSPRDFNASCGLVSNEHTNRSFSLSHNLPDKNLICSRFVGREEVLSRLWEWLSDDFEYTKILSGDGGKGKTSIAYEFCRSFIQSPPIGYERVVWLSAKEHQFSGFTNRYFDLQDSDYSDAHSFLMCLAENCALGSDEYEGVSPRVIKKELKDALVEFPSLIVVDDIDSLEDDDQRKVVDACRQLAGEKIRFLITTRKKLAYSSDLCIDVPGLPIDEFTSFVDSLRSRYSLKELKTKEISRLHVECDGSPLLASSILRIYKQDSNLNSAIREWSSHAGVDARNAALKREIESLSSDASRLLLAIFYFKSCSFTELRQAAGYEKVKLVDCLEELQSLFLVNEPKIINSEERFSISNTTALIVSDMTKELAFDHQRLRVSIKKMREKDTPKKTGNRRLIGLAINQALAFLRENQFDEAIKTVDAMLASYKSNPDLLLMKSRCIISQLSPDFNLARELLRLSVKEGQRKELVYDLWFQSEKALNSANGMIECSSVALSNDATDHNRWNQNQARGYVLRSKERTGDAFISDLMDASLCLTKSFNNAGKIENEFLKQEQYGLHDFIWEELERDPDFSWLSSFDKMLEMISRGDIRTNMYRNTARCLIEAKSEDEFSDKKANAYRICSRKFEKLLDSRSSRDKLVRPFDDLAQAI